MAKKEFVEFYLETYGELKKIELNCENDFDSKCLERLMKRSNLDKI